MLIFYSNLADKTQNYEDYQTGEKCNKECNSSNDCESGCSSCRRVHETPGDTSSPCFRNRTHKHVSGCITKCAPQLEPLCTLSQKNCSRDNDCKRAPSSDPLFVPSTRESCTKCKYLFISSGCTAGDSSCENIFRCREP